MMYFEKNSEFYLSQINQNIDEKVSELISLMVLNKLPKNKQGVIKIFEFGIGGCGQFQLINRYAQCDSLIIGADILNIRNSIEHTGAIFKQMDITNITDSDISVINASAIFHEVFSYGDFMGKLGFGALKTAFSSINKSLNENGYLIYRDLLYPKYSKRSKVKIFYMNGIFVYFYNFFISTFLTALQKTEENFEDIIVKETSNKLFITTTPVIHREIQRHYLTFRDFCRNDELIKTITGINIQDHFFTDIKKGQKTFFIKIKINDINHRFIQKYNLEKCKRFSAANNSNEGVYRVNSEIFDLFYDDIISSLFSKKNNIFFERINIWLKREGKERYVYANFLSLIKLGIDSGEEYILFPENASSLKIIERNYYNRYLEKNIDIPEKDGKQIIIFKKMKAQNAIRILKDIKQKDDYGIFEDNDEYYVLKNKLNSKLK